MVISAIAGMFACGRRRERTAAPSGTAREPRSNEEQEVSGRASTLREQTRLSDAGQVETAATAHEESSDTVELAYAGTATEVSGGPCNAVSHIQTWRRADIESAACDASGHPQRTVMSIEAQDVSGQAPTQNGKARLRDGGRVEAAAPAHVASLDTVELASAGTAGVVSVGPGNAVSHIKTWRRAVIESVAHDASGQAQLTVRFGHGDCLTAEASHFEVEDQYLLERSGLGGGDANHRAPYLETERADKHREGEPAMADLAGVRAASPKRGERVEQESGERAQHEVEAGIAGQDPMAALEAATSLASAALAADWPGRREAVATAAAMLAAGRTKRGGESTTATGEDTRDIRACLQAGIEARPSGHSSPTPPPARQGMRCLRPTCRYQAHTCLLYTSPSPRDRG